MLSIPRDTYIGTNDNYADGTDISWIWDVNFEALQMAITPSAEKLAKHGVKSVRQRVMNLHDKNAELTTERMQNHLMSAFGTHTRDLSAEEITAIDEIEATYLDPLFIQGKESHC